MRIETNRQKVELFMAALGRRVRGSGKIYLTGGATAVLHGWRDSTVDIDIKAEPEPGGFFEAIAVLKDELQVNVELASPDDFIPALPEWRERSPFISRHGDVEFFHYDPYGQTLSKLQRSHPRDSDDVRSFVRSGLIRVEKLASLFASIEPQLVRYPAIDAAEFRRAVDKFISDNR